VIFLLSFSTAIDRHAVGLLLLSRLLIIMTVLVICSSLCHTRAISILDGCIVWNAHNTVFVSKHSAICALAVYFVHSKRPKIQSLVSCDSLVDRQFVTAWVRELVTNIRFMCRTVPSAVAADVVENLGRFLVRSVQARRINLN